VVTGWDGAQLFARIAHDIAEQHGKSATTQRIVDLAKTATGCDMAAVWHIAAGVPQVDASTDDETAAVIRRYVKLARQGAALEAIRTRSTIVVHDAAHDPRFPVYTDQLRQRGVHLVSTVAYPLRIEDRDLGALAMYSNTRGFFTEDVVAMGGVFANHAAIALDAAYSLDRAQNLQLALETNRSIGIAIGIVMSHYKVTREAAFDMLRMCSQHGHRKLHDVAEEVTQTGALPEWQKATA
jgi:GAF domain-containing protein